MPPAEVQKTLVPEVKIEQISAPVEEEKVTAPEVKTEKISAPVEEPNKESEDY